MAEERVTRRTAGPVQPGLEWQPRAQDYLIGTHVRKVLDDGRVVLPRAWLTCFGSHAYAWQASDEELRVFPEGFWLARARELDDRQAADERHERQAAEFFSRTTRLTVDPQGRLLLPRELRRSRGIESSVLLVGRGSFFEVQSFEGLDDWASATGADRGAP